VHKQDGTLKSGSDSVPELSQLPRALKTNPIRKHKSPSNTSSGVGRGIDASGGSQGEQNVISRKTAQTFLSGLSNGYIKKIDNAKLVKSCLSGSVTTRGKKSSRGRGSQEFQGKPGEVVDEQKATKGKKKKEMNKSFENLKSGNRLNVKQPQLLLSAADSLLNQHSSN
jgi:hypothetical protein